MIIPEKQIRALFDDNTIRVYQAYNNIIADTAMKAQTFVTPPFKLNRMTWIKPSFLWMMYRCGWGKKEHSQARVLAIDIKRTGFEWALRNSCLSHKPQNMETEQWNNIKNQMPVRLQWDPERTIHLEALQHRSIQIGLSKEAVDLFVNNWIVKITDITKQADDIHHYLVEGDLIIAENLLPTEKPYSLDPSLKKIIGAS